MNDRYWRNPERPQIEHHKEKYHGIITAARVDYCECDPEAIEKRFVAIEDLIERNIEGISALYAMIGTLNPTDDYTTVIEYVDYNIRLCQNALEDLRATVDSNNINLLAFIESVQSELYALRDDFYALLNKLINRIDVFESENSEEHQELRDLIAELDSRNTSEHDMILEMIEALRKKEASDFAYLSSEISELDNALNNHIYEFRLTVEELRELIRSLYVLIGEIDFPSELEDNTIAGYLQWIVDMTRESDEELRSLIEDLRELLFRIRDELRSEDAFLLARIDDLENEILALIGDFKPTENYNTITEFIVYVYNTLNNKIIELSSELSEFEDSVNDRFYNLEKDIERLINELRQEFYSETTVIKERLDKLEEETSELDVRVTELEDKVEKLEGETYIFTYHEDDIMLEFPHNLNQIVVTIKDA